MCRNSRGNRANGQCRFNRDLIPVIIFVIVLKKKKRLFIISLDGVPFSFLTAGIAAGRFPRIAELGTPVRMDSVLPPISSVAWTSFSTGVDPGEHGIFGFVDRDPATMRMRLVNARDIAVSTLWVRLSAAGKRVIAMNVPMTYPPPMIDGIVISGFLAPELSRAVMPATVLPRLQRVGYRIDPDHTLGLSNRGRYLDQIRATFAARRKAVFELMGEKWDFFMVHVMMTDRINHFFWADGCDPAAEFHSDFWEFYAAVDRFVGEVTDRLPAGTDLLLLSDHGFCRLRYEVDINAYLADGGFLRFRRTGDGLARIDPTARAYSLIPGRIYINLRGREGIGSVPPADYNRVRSDISAYLAELSRDGAPVIARVFQREEVYHGRMVNLAPDLIALPNDGYDLKAKFAPGEVFAEEQGRSGMHTFPDAFVLLTGRRLRSGGSIVDVTPTIFALLGLPSPPEFTGTPLTPEGS